MPRPVYRGEYRLWQRVGIVARLVVRGVLPGGWSRVAAFARSLPWRAPRQLPLAIVDWIAGLAMREYAVRHLSVGPASAPAAVARWIRPIERAAAAYVRTGEVQMSLLADRLRLTVRLQGLVDRDFFRRTARPVERLLRRTPASLVLRVEELRESAIPEIERWLARLARYGDRVSVSIAERWRSVLRVDSSVFDLVLEPDGRRADIARRT
jgi:hypothetical protein